MTSIPSTTAGTLFDIATTGHDSGEDPNYLTKQLLTYLGNKRLVLPHIEDAVMEVRERLGGRRLRVLDAFSGSGVVARAMKRHAAELVANDLESYARVMNECFLADYPEETRRQVAQQAKRLNDEAEELSMTAPKSRDGIISRLYAPEDDSDIRPGERAFYTSSNAQRLDHYRRRIASSSNSEALLLLGPLLSKASVHANTSGVFKGFYKDPRTGVGKFGGGGANALTRILAPINLESPVRSRFSTRHLCLQLDANSIDDNYGRFDLVYIDPPYNQHPYGSNYFMLNLLVDYAEPTEISKVSGIPPNWNRSQYNVKQRAAAALEELISNVDAKYLLISFSDEGFISPEAMRNILSRYGQWQEKRIRHNVFRGSRNLGNRDLHLHEHLYLLEKGA